MNQDVSKKISFKTIELQNKTHKKLFAEPGA